MLRNWWVNGFVAATLLTPAVLSHMSVAAAGEVVVHSFKNNGADGYEPYGALTSVNGTLYGTTYFGGANGLGTVYTISGTTEKVVYSFQNNGVDGAYPADGLINVKGTLYGTTYGGGIKAVGTVFRLSSATGKQKVVYSFAVLAEHARTAISRLAD